MTFKNCLSSPRQPIFLKSSPKLSVYVKILHSKFLSCVVIGAEIRAEEPCPDIKHKDHSYRVWHIIYPTPYDGIPKYSFFVAING